MQHRHTTLWKRPEDDLSITDIELRIVDASCRMIDNYRKKFLLGVDNIRGRSEGYDHLSVLSCLLIKKPREVRMSDLKVKATRQLSE